MEETEKIKILLVEDGEGLSRIGAAQLTDFGYEVICALNGETAVEVLRREQIDMILLDGPDIMKAFWRGGSDYIAKSMQPEILAEHIERMLERIRNAGLKGDRRWFKQFMIDKSRREVYRVENGCLEEKIPLSPLEYRILQALTEHQDEVTLYRQLYRDVWQQEDLGDVRPLMVHVSNLRKKVNLNHTEMITAVRGVGYLFQDE